MKINYYLDKNNRTIGVASYEEQEVIPNGLPNDLFFVIDEMATTSERRKLKNNTKLKAHSIPYGTDEFDVEIGKEIVRDKLIVKDAYRSTEKLLIYKKYLEQILCWVNNSIEGNTQRLNNAQDRLKLKKNYN